METIASTLRKNIQGYLSSDIICFKMRTERISRKPANFEEQIMSRDKYTSSFSCKIEALQSLSFKHFAARAGFFFSVFQ